jgi:transcriptional regulator with XRE-family HTH domain
MLLGLSQEKLGEALGVTFQQVQKYEKGTNRIGAGRLQDIAKVLEAPPSFFFQDAPTTGSVAAGSFEDSGSAGFVVSFLSTVEGLQLNKAFASIKDPKVRRRLVDLVVAIAASEAADPG